MKGTAFLRGIKLGTGDLKDALSGDLGRVEALMQSSLGSEVPYIEGLNKVVLTPSGKLLRPALLILSAAKPGRSEYPTLLAAAVVEMIHTATLLHDDVVDGGHRRRGLPTLNARNGDASAVLMGDYVYSRAITLLVEAELTQVLSLLAMTVHRMSVGELMQLEIRDEPRFDEASYLKVIYEKTARLIESACRSGAILGGLPPVQIEALGDFGRELGLSFQIIDDVLDYVADPEVLGKPVGSDLAEGKQTLPLIKVHKRASLTLKARIEALLPAARDRPQALDSIGELLAIVREEGGIEAALADARRFGEAARSALRRLPDGVIRDALDATVDYVIERKF